MGRSRKNTKKLSGKATHSEKITETEAETPNASNEGIDCCPVCNVAANQRCGGCKKVFYCGREHQREHWPLHKALCKASTLVESQCAELGRYLAAGRDIRPGELLLEEKPLITFPPPSTAPLCLACYKELRVNEYIDCPRCGWPLCSEQCAADPGEHALECALTSENRPDRMRIRTFGMPHPSYQAIGALRCLALEKSAPRKWEALIQLESHSEARAGSPRDQQERFTIAQFARRTLPGLADKHSEEDILRLCGILHINGHELPLQEPSLVTVYAKASLLAHSCRANCCKSFSSEGAVRIRAARPIKAGEPITICYTDSLWNTRARRLHLNETKLFWCRCERCLDPSEFGTDFGALRCQRCGKAGVNPQLDADGSDDWVCRHCESAMPATAALSLLERVVAELDNMDKGDILACQRFLKRWAGETLESEGSKTALSPDHQYLTDVRLALVQLYGVGGPGALPALKAAELNHKIVLCRRLLKLAAQLIPAEHRLRGLVLFELHAALAEEARRRGAEDEAELARTILQESKRCLEETIELLRYEPPELPEGQVLLQAKRNLHTMTCLLEPPAGLQLSPGGNLPPPMFIFQE